MEARVYKNLNLLKQGKVGWSVRAKVHGKWLVVAHASDVALSGVSFTISEASRQRCLRLKCREVHGWATGEVCAVVGLRVTEAGELDAGVAASLRAAQAASVPDLPVSLSYRPFESGTFHVRATGKPVEGAALVHLTMRGGCTVP